MSAGPARRSAVAAAALVAVAAGAGACLRGAEGAAFGLFAALAVGGGAACAFERSLARAVHGLLAAFTGTAGLFLLLESDFLAVAQIALGAGGTLALLHFGARLAPQDRDERSLARPLVALIAIAALCGLAAWRCAGAAAFTGAKPAAAKPPASDADVVGVALVDPKQHAVAFELGGLLLVVALVAALSTARRAEAEDGR